MNVPHLIVCLGNPGREYEKTRHNIGFKAADLLIQRFNLIDNGKKFKSDFWKGTVENKTLLLLKPLTYMNLSGEAALAAKTFYKLPNANIIVIYDDIDIPLGSIRMREMGSAGTHNGMKSMVQLLGGQDFPRLRIGIGPKPEHGPLNDFVLSNFREDELRTLSPVLDQISDQVLKWLRS